MYIIKVIDECGLVYLRKKGVATLKSNAKKFLTKKQAEKFLKKFLEEYKNWSNENFLIISWKLEKDLEQTAQTVASHIIYMIKSFKKYNTGDYDFVANEFADLIIEEIKNRWLF